MSEFTQTKLFEALQDLSDESPGKVAELLEEGEDIHLTGEFGESYLHIVGCCEDDRKLPYVIPVIYKLSNAGINPNIQDKEGNTALHVASLNDCHHRLVNTLIKIGVDPCLRNREGLTAEDLAETEETSNVYEFFYPGLWVAVENEDIDKVRILLDSWCKTDIKREGRKLIKVAEEIGNEPIVALLKEKKNTNALVHAALSGEAKTVKELTKKEGVDVNTLDISYLRHDGERTPISLLHECVIFKSYDAAKILAKKGADVNMLVQDTKTSTPEPLFYYLLKRCNRPDEDCFNQIMKKADISLIGDDHSEVFYSFWKRRVPEKVVQQFIDKGLVITDHDRNGYTVRDKIFLDCAQKGLKKDDRRAHLLFVDQHIIQMAVEGEVDKLRKLALDGYSHLNVVDRKGKSASQLAKKAKQKETVEFLESLPSFQAKIRSMHLAIQRGNLAQAREFFDPSTIKAKDRVGRNALHVAVLYERRFVIKYILKEYVDTIKGKDNYDRTPLHYACAVPDGRDVEDMLARAGAKETDKDCNGKTAAEYRMYRSAMDFIENERTNTAVSEVYLLDQYTRMVDAIDDGNYDTLTEIKEGMYEDVTLETIEQLSRNEGIKYKPLLFVCLEKKREQMARYLIGHGADYNISVEYEGRAMYLPEVARKMHMDGLYDFIKRHGIEKKMRETRESQTKMAVRNAITSAMDRGRSTRTDSLFSPSPDCSYKELYADDSDEAYHSDNPTPPNQQPVERQIPKKSSSCIIL